MARRTTFDCEPLRLAALDSYDILDTDYDEAFDRYTRLAATLTGAPVAALSFADADRSWLKSVHGATVRQTARELAFYTHAMLDARLVVIGDTLSDPRFASHPMVVGEPGIRFYAGAPLRAQGGHVVGALCTVDTAPRTISPEQGLGLADLADAAVSTLELYKTMRAMKALALTDALTGLPNRAQFFHFLRTTLQTPPHANRPLSLLYLDCDDFQRLNDAGGHDEGDRALRLLASVLHEGVRSADFAARLGNDEFAVILPESGERPGLSVAKRMMQNTQAAMAQNGWKVTMSGGLATFLIPPGSADTALAAAGHALHHAKLSGKDRIHAVTLSNPAAIRLTQPIALVTKA